MNKPSEAYDPILAGRLSEAQAAHFKDQGYVHVPGLVSPDALEALRRNVKEVLAARNQPDSFLAQAGEYLRGSPIDRLVNSPNLNRVVVQLLGGPSSLYANFTAVKGPGQGQFTFHQDNNYTLLRGPALNCWIALMPMTVANGSLRVVPRSHLQGTVESKPSEECAGHRKTVEAPTSWIDAVTAPGDAIIFDRLTVHGSGPNNKPDPRLAYAVQFHRNDTEAFFDDSWELLCKRPKYDCGPVESYTSLAQASE